MQHIRLCNDLGKKKISWGTHYKMEDFKEDWFTFAGMYQYHGRSIEGEEM